MTQLTHQNKTYSIATSQNLTTYVLYSKSPDYNKISPYRNIFHRYGRDCYGQDIFTSKQHLD